MAIKVGNLDLAQYAIQTRQALEAYRTTGAEAQATVAEVRTNPGPQPVAAGDLAGVLSDEERQALNEAFGGLRGADLGFIRRTNASTLKGSRIDLSV